MRRAVLPRNFLLEVVVRQAQALARGSTFGSHFRIRFALVMSGQRCFGSSCGSGRKTIGAFARTSARTRSANSRIVISCGLPMFTGSCSFDSEQPINSFDQIGHVAKTARLFPVAVDGDGLAASAPGTRNSAARGHRSGACADRKY